MIFPSSLFSYVSGFLLPPFFPSLTGIADSSGSHFSAELTSWFFSYFHFNPNLLPLSLKPHFSSQMHNAWRNSRDAFLWSTRDVLNPIPVKQMSYINFSLRKPRCKTERKRGRGKEKKRGTKEWSRRLLKSSRRLNVRPHMLQCKHTQRDCNNGVDAVSIPLCNLPTILIMFFFFLNYLSSPPSLQLSPDWRKQRGK